MLEECTAMERAGLSIEAGTMDTLLSYNWPGNIRQLRHAIRYACAIAEGPQIRLEHFPHELRGGNKPVRASLAPPMMPTAVPALAAADPCDVDSGAPLNETCLQLRQKMLEALRRNHWKVTETARQLNMSRATFYRKMARLRIVAPNYLDGGDRVLQQE